MKIIFPNKRSIPSPKGESPSPTETELTEPIRACTTYISTHTKCCIIPYAMLCSTSTHTKYYIAPIFAYINAHIHSYSTKSRNKCYAIPKHMQISNTYKFQYDARYTCGSPVLTGLENHTASYAARDWVNFRRLGALARQHVQYQQWKAIMTRLLRLNVTSTYSIKRHLGITNRHYVILVRVHHTHVQTDRQTDRQTYRQKHTCGVSRCGSRLLYSSQL